MPKYVHERRKDRNRYPPRRGMRSQGTICQDWNNYLADISKEEEYICLRDDETAFNL